LKNVLLHTSQKKEPHMKLLHKAIVAGSLAMLSGVGFAQVKPYIGLDAYKDSDSKVGPGITLGLKFAPTLGGELSYRQADASFNSNVKLKVIRAVVVGEFPMGNGAALFGDLGIGHVKASAFGTSIDGTGVAGALGVKYYFSPQFAAQLKYEYSGPNSGYSAGAVLGLQYHF
jgi:Outer membrane protein beta-barrel domain